MNKTNKKPKNNIKGASSKVKGISYEPKARKESRNNDGLKKKMNNVKLVGDGKQNRSRSSSKNRSNTRKLDNKKMSSLEKKKGRQMNTVNMASYKSGQPRGADKRRASMKNARASMSAPKSGGTCFLCFCCGGNEEEALNEILMEEERLRMEEERRLQREREEKEKKRLELEKEKEKEREREREELRKAKEEEEKRRLEEEAKRIEEMNELTEREQTENINEEPTIVENVSPNKTVLKKLEFKAKQAPKKAKLNFIGAAAAPAPPPPSACMGNPPKAKQTSVRLGEGAYLVYRNNGESGELIVKYSKTALTCNGVLAYISSNKIPPFYFEQNKGETIVVKNVSTIMQSAFINDRKTYYNCWVEFIKKVKQFNGTFYLLPANDVQPPPKVDIMLLNASTKEITNVPIDKPVEFVGDYLIVIQSGLEIFKKEINVASIVTYVNSFGALMEL